MKVKLICKHYVVISHFLSLLSEKKYDTSVLANNKAKTLRMGNSSRSLREKKEKEEE